MLNSNLNNNAHSNTNLKQSSQIFNVPHLTSNSNVKKARFEKFKETIDTQLLNHPIIVNNSYTKWFEKGEQRWEDIRNFITQFSVFSNQFLIAQTCKMINAENLENMRASKEILANEIGVLFKPDGQKLDKDADFNMENMPISGSINGSIFKFQAGHFEWLLNTAKSAGLEFSQLGKRRNGISSTLEFCDKLINLYGNEDYQTSLAASFAVENWANKGFWKDLINGFKSFNQKNDARIAIGFFTWHDQIEAQHAQHTYDELEEEFLAHDIDEEKFIQVGNEMLNAIGVFWNGLDNCLKVA